ncbi:MAG: sigma-70 family RNA polymerase sigma factor [Bacteroidota bacterium]|nr:sigma-70 family RNA polymerase sigma factor [Bacteroidota bacterium]MDP4213544.1 sigma-70 family RNA polymerase sigma factor [Bacteroidota bacterium]MDP4250545.1 sigma-70 family RNA polymerase sigma factor [Bacteroidota bacterium]
MRKEQDDECKIWSQFKNGDIDAFAAIYQRHSVDLLCYGSKICSNQEILKDAIQDLYVELWNSRKNLAHVDSVKFYLFRALRYKLIRAEKRRQQHNPSATDSSVNAYGRFEIPVETAIIDKEIQASRINILRKAIKSLSKRQQEVIQLRFYQGFSNDQIADLMNMNYQSVSNLVYNALCRIKKNLRTPEFSTTLVAALCLFF